MDFHQQIITIVEGCGSDFQRIPHSEWSHKPTLGKWSKKEILGHLVDSAMNNMRRVLVTQYQQNDKIFYLQDEWVKMQDYQSMDIVEIVQLWESLNKQFARIIKNVPLDKLEYTCDTGKAEPELHTLAFLIDDYIRHMNHHLAQIIGSR